MIFNGLSSAVYIINDIIDAPLDKKHPVKKKRPIASGKFPIPLAWAISIGLLASVLLLAWFLNPFFFLMLLTYLVINLAYTAYLKHQPILDVVTIASGFVLRVYAGALIVNLHMNVWFLFTVISLSLFLAVGKRQSERTLLSGFGSLMGHRATLTAYSERLLDIYTAMFATATWLSYSLFTFQLQFELSDGPIPTIFSLIPRTFVSSKWLMATVPLVIYGIMRYLQLIYERNQGESPERVLLSDKPLLVSVTLWVALVFFIIYGLA